MNYKIQILAKEETNLPVPKCSYTSKISIQPAMLSRILTNLEKVSEFVAVESSANKVQFSGSSVAGDAKINIDTDNPELDAVQSPAGIVSNYSLEYMIKVIRSIGKASNVVNMEYDSEKPMRLDFEMPSNTKVQYYLAPRIK